MKTFLLMSLFIFLDHGTVRYIGDIFYHNIIITHLNPGAGVKLDRFVPLDHGDIQCMESYYHEGGDMDQGHLYGPALFFFRPIQ